MRTRSSIPTIIPYHSLPPYLSPSLSQRYQYRLIIPHRMSAPTPSFLSLIVYRTLSKRSLLRNGTPLWFGGTRWREFSEPLELRLLEQMYNVESMYIHLHVIIDIMTWIAKISLRYNISYISSVWTSDSRSVYRYLLMYYFSFSFSLSPSLNTATRVFFIFFNLVRTWKAWTPSGPKTFYQLLVIMHHVFSHSMLAGA